MYYQVRCRCLRHFWRFGSLKDNIDKFIETSKQKFEKCQENEKHLVECFNHDFDRKREESEEEIKSLMGKIELERHRHAERRRELCSTIEVYNVLLFHKIYSVQYCMWKSIVFVFVVIVKNSFGSKSVYLLHKCF